MYRMVILIAVLFMPGLAMSMDFNEARHLLSRIGFRGTPTEIDRLTLLKYELAVQSLLDGTNYRPLSAPPVWVNNPPPDFKKMRAMSEAERKAFHKECRKEALDLNA